MMPILALAGIVAIAAPGCSKDDGDASNGRGDTSQGGGSQSGGGAGSGGQEFGNSEGFVPPPPSMNLDIAGGDCKPGHYVGQLDGMYTSPAAFGLPVVISTDRSMAPPGFFDLGAWGIPGLPPADPAAMPMMMLEEDAPGFEFWLEASEEVVDCEPVPGEEFTFCPDFKVEGGKARGIANNMYPFEMDLNGELDCEAGKFQGVLENGWYEVGGVIYNYTGTIEGDYDSVNAEFFNGVWTVAEDVDPNFGGTGTWYTAWVMD